MQVEESIVVVGVVSVSTDVGWVVIPYYYYDFKQTKATQILLLIAFESAFLTTEKGQSLQFNMGALAPPPPHIPREMELPCSMNDTIKDTLMSENMGYQNP